MAGVWWQAVWPTSITASRYEPIIEEAGTRLYLANHQQVMLIEAGESNLNNPWV